MIKRIIAASLLLLSLVSCAPSAKFNCMVYLPSPYTYDIETQLPILNARDNSPGRHWHNEFRGRNWR